MEMTCNVPRKRNKEAYYNQSCSLQRERTLWGTMEKCCHLKGKKEKNKAVLRFPQSKTSIQKMVQKWLKVLGETVLRHAHFGCVRSPLLTENADKLQSAKGLARKRQNSHWDWIYLMICQGLDEFRGHSTREERKLVKILARIVS